METAKLAAVRRLHRWPSAVAKLREAAWRSLDGYSHERMRILQHRILAVEADDVARSATRWLAAGAAANVSIGGQITS